MSNTKLNKIMTDNFEKGSAPLMGTTMGTRAVSYNTNFKAAIKLKVRKYDYSINYTQAALLDGQGPPQNVTIGSTVHPILSSQTAITNSPTIPLGLQVPVPVHFFGNSDFFTGYQKAFQETPIAQGSWNLLNIFAVSGETQVGSVRLDNSVVSETFFNSPSVSQNRANQGDIVLQYFSIENPISEEYVLYIREVVVSCQDVAYSSLLSATQSDRFKINGIRNQ